MANPEHVEIIKQGVEVWNKWRDEYPDIQPDLSETKNIYVDTRGIGVNDLRFINLSNANLDKCGLHSTNLAGANLRRATLKEANLSLSILDEADCNEADLSKADLSSTNLSKTSFNKASLSKAYIVEADLSNANFTYANLQGVNLGSSILANTDFSYADLSEARFSPITFTVNTDPSDRKMYYETIIDETIFRRANLRGANFTNTTPINSNFENANLEEANFEGVVLNGVDFSCISLRQASFVNATLIRAILNHTDLREAKLGGCDLTQASFIEAQLSNVDLSGAYLCETDFSKANLTGCRLYGIAAWDVKLEETIQKELVITKINEPEITIDNLEIAQFIYLLLNNQKIRQVIDTITSKVVLILGRFTPERKSILDVLRDILRHHNYSPVVFNFDEQSCEDLIETARTLASMAHFVLADLTNLDDRVHEIATSMIPRCVVPIQPFLLGSHHYNHTLFRELQQKYRWVLSPHRYRDISDLLESFQKQIIQPAEEKIIELKQRKPLKIFFDYAHEDKEMLDTLKKHLKPLERSGQIEMWDDRDVEPGNTKNEEIEKQLSDARIILLLMSPDFIASNDCYMIQERAMRGSAKVIPIFLRSCAWKSTPLGQLQVLPRDEKPMKEHDPDNIFFEVSEEISDVIKEMM